RLQLVRSFYQVETLIVPLAVYREVGLTRLLPQLAALPWIAVSEAGESSAEALRLEAWAKLGPGEQEAISLASKVQALLLTNDAQAGRVARRLGIEVANVPAFLLAVKLAGLADRSELAAIVRDLREKDRYAFRADLLDLLLS
ncbi:MAG TPA: hypothetical protein VGE98_03445, partial [Thermoanaerobaculia bacterium]